MRRYKIIFEVFFVRLPGSEHQFGLFSTHYQNALDAKSALEAARSNLRRKLNDVDVKIIRDGIFRTRLVVDDIWEVMDLSNEPGGTGGFTFFEIKLWSRLKLIVRYTWLYGVKRHFVVPLE